MKHDVTPIAHTGIKNCNAPRRNREADRRWCPPSARRPRPARRPRGRTRAGRERARRTRRRRRNRRERPGNWAKLSYSCDSPEKQNVHTGKQLENKRNTNGIRNIRHGRVFTPIAHAVQRHFPPLLVAQRLVVLRERPNLPADDAHERERQTQRQRQPQTGGGRRVYVLLKNTMSF